MSRIIVKNIPKEITEKQLRDHFSIKGEVTDVKIMKKENGESRRFAFIGFKTEEQTQTCIKYFNNTYLFTCKIQVEPAIVQGDPSLNKQVKQKKFGTNKGKEDKQEDEQSKQNKINKILELAKMTSNKSKFNKATQKLSEEAKQDETAEVGKNEPQKTIDDTLNPEKLDPKRLYLRNLPFEVTEGDLRTTFERFGELTEIHIPIDYKTNLSLGYAYVGFATVESSILALSEMDKKIYQGRILHITPAKQKEEKEKVEIVKKSSEFKTTKYEKQRAGFDDETNWNYLFMNQNAVIDAISKKLNIPKSEIMSKDNPNLAVQVAAMETTIINETKEWLTHQGINLDLLKGKRKGCSRSKNILLVKNISPNIEEGKLEEYFSRYGMLVRFTLSPSNTLGIAEFVDSKHAFNCMKKLAYWEIDNLPLYLEFAPEGFVKSDTKKKPLSNETEDISLVNSEGKVIFVTNLNFNTNEKTLERKFIENSFEPTKVKIITHQKGGNVLSSGFGFVEFDSEDEANKAVRAMQGVLVDGHSLKLNIAKSSDEKKNNLLGNKRQAETQLNEFDYEGEDVEMTKILVKNLAFEANRDELRKLFKTYGEVKTVRLPSKLDGTHRGFAFIDFVSNEEAKTAFKSLQNSHFYGRKLVLEWAKKDKNLDELREQTERKVKASNIQTHRKQRKGELIL
jgi:multiple RNA-binding domain-containing protein 1